MLNGFRRKGCSPMSKSGDRRRQPYVILDKSTKDVSKRICLLQVSVATGCAARERNIVFASGLATFFSRAYDQLRMAAISESNINLCGSYCGLSAGKDTFLWFYKRQSHQTFAFRLLTFTCCYMNQENWKHK